MTEPKKDPVPELEEQTPSMDDINDILRAAGLTPIGEEPAAAAPQPSPEKTRHFELPKKQPPAAPPAQPEEENDSQLLLDGFDKAETPAHVSEADVEASLQRSRKNLVENFRVLSQEESDGTILEQTATGDGAESVFDSVEVRRGESLFDAVAQAQPEKKEPRRIRFDRTKLLKATEMPQAEPVDLKTRRAQLETRKKHARVHALAQVILFGLALLLLVSAAFYTPGGVLEFLFGHAARPFTFFNLLLVLVCAVFGRETIKTAVAHAKAHTISTELCVTGLAAMTVLHGIWVLIAGMDETTGYTSFALCAVFAFFAQSAGEYLAAQTGLNDLAALENSADVRQLLPVENAADATQLGHGITTRTAPQILYSTEPGSADSLLFTDADPMHGKALTYAAAAALVLSFAFALVRAVSEKSGVLFANAFISAVFLCVPFLRELLTRVLKARNDAALSAAGVAVLDLAAAQRIGESDAVALDSSEVFDAKVSNFRAVPGGGMSREDAALYAAAALHRTPSLLAAPFAALAEELGRTLPAAEDLQYEDKLGYSCWVAGRRVLVGNRDMLVQHSIPAPTAEEEYAYAKNRCVLYVAVEGYVAATFIATYRVRSDVKKFCRTFERTGVLLMLGSGDPNLSEEYVARRLSLHVATVKILNAKNRQIVEDTRRSAEKTRNDGLLCGGSHRHLLLLINAAHRFFEADRLAGIVQFAGLAFCFVLLLLCVIFKISTFFTPLTVIFLQLLWSFVAYYIGAARMKK